jgi:hypothetical protein
MSEKTNARNISSLNENDKMMYARIMEMDARIKVLEATVAHLAADVANTKQLIGHTLGRGMGSTTN